MTEPKTKHELRCFCRARPMLAMYGKNKDNKLYIHIKVYKRSQVYGEVVVTEGVVQLRCRECFRWHRVRIIAPDKAELIEDSKPALEEIV